MKLNKRRTMRSKYTTKDHKRPYFDRGKGNPKSKDNYATAGCLSDCRARGEACQTCFRKDKYQKPMEG